MKAINLKDVELPPPPHNLVIRQGNYISILFHKSIKCDNYNQKGFKERGSPEGLCTLCGPRLAVHQPPQLLAKHRDT